jgi:hypothetical protein
MNIKSNCEKCKCTMFKLTKAIEMLGEAESVPQARIQSSLYKRLLHFARHSGVTRAPALSGAATRKTRKTQKKISKRNKGAQHGPLNPS